MSEGIGGQPGGWWSSYGNPALSTVLQLGGLGLTANRGALGPPLTYLGGMLDRAREGNISQEATQRFAQLMQPRQERVEIPGTGRPMQSEPEGSLPALPPTVRTWGRDPTSPEVWQEFGRMEDVSGPVRSAMLERLWRTPLAREAGRPPFSIETEVERGQRDLERRDLGTATERHLADLGVDPRIAASARDVVERGGHPTTPIPPRLEAQEREFNRQLAEQYPNGIRTGEEALAAAQAARAAGLDHVADRIEKGWRLRKEVGEEGRVSRVKEQSVPRWRQEVETFRKAGVPELTLQALTHVIENANDQPTEKNVSEVNRAMGAAAKSGELAKAQAARMAAYQRRTEQMERGRDERLRAQAGQALLRDLAKDIARYTTIANTGPDAVTRVHAADMVSQLQQHQEDVRERLRGLAYGGGGAAEPGAEPPPPSRGGEAIYDLTPGGQLVPGPR
jgi:hypothetical protein